MAETKLSKDLPFDIEDTYEFQAEAFESKFGDGPELGKTAGNPSGRRQDVGSNPTRSKRFINSSKASNTTPANSSLKP